MKVKTLAIDLGKSVFQFHGVNQTNKAVFQRKIKRNNFLNTVLKLAPDEVVMEACGGSNFWGRSLEQQGIAVRLIAPQYVKPFVRTNKNDSNDAEAICEAAARPSIPSVAIKTIDQQALQSVHRIRDRLVCTRTSFINQLHGLVAEFGFVLPKAHKALRVELYRLLESSNLPALLHSILENQLTLWMELNKRIKACEQLIKDWVKQHEEAQHLMELPGIAHIVSSALIMHMGSPALYRNGRQYSASLGLAPRQCSTGGKSVLRGISKRGDSYVRKLLIHGARAMLRVAPNKTDRLSRWACELKARRGANRAVVAVANKLARIAWAMLAKQTTYKPSLMA